MDAITVTTEHKIGKTTYIIEARASENATETLKEKVNKLLIRDLRQISSNMAENGLK